MRYVRFALSSRSGADAGTKGVFRAVHDLKRAESLHPHEIGWLDELDGWFGANLRAPSRLALRGGYRQPKPALCWFKDSAKEHLHRIRSLVALLREHGVEVAEHMSAQPGNIVYEDEHQVAAVPFGTTRRNTAKRRRA